MLYKTPAVLSLLLISANAFADTVGSVLLPNLTVPNACTIDYLGTYSDTSYMVPIYEPITYNCNPGYYLPVNTTECTICPNNHYCIGGLYTYSETETQGIENCPGKLLSPQGMHEAGSCGRLLHIGNETIYLRSTKKTTPSLNIDIDNDGVPDFFGNATTQRTTINNTSHRFLHVGDYYIYDDSIKIDE